jgi:hypothetical protein
VGWFTVLSSLGGLVHCAWFIVWVGSMCLVHRVGWFTVLSSLCVGWFTVLGSLCVVWFTVLSSLCGLVHCA